MSDTQPTASRRGFFLSATAAGAAVASASLIGKSEPTVVVEALKPAPEKGGGYTLSAHVKQYYKTTLV
jgi:hypothetical protein